MDAIVGGGLHLHLMLLTDWVIRTGTEENAAEIAQLVNRAYSGDGGGWTNELMLVEGPRTSEGGIREMMERGLFRVARETDAGPIRASVFLEKRGHNAYYIGMLSVEPSMQDRGLGKTMMQECEVFARSHNVPKLALTVLEGRDTLQAWYKRHGFEPTGERVSLAHLKGLDLLAYEKVIGLE